MTEIIPAILPKDYADLKSKLFLLISLTKTVQIDICDGMYVPSSTWPFDGETKNLKSFVKKDEGLPFWEDFDFEFDCMVKNIENYIDDLAKIGASRVILHYDSIENKEKIDLVVNSLKEFDISVGGAFSLKEEYEEIAKNINKFDFVQLMGIRKIGFQGQKFEEDIIKRVLQLRKDFPQVIISVDGGVNQETAKKLIDASVNRLVVGSAIFESNDIANTIKTFESIK